MALAVAAALIQGAESLNFTYLTQVWQTIVVHREVEGTASLPDPDVINAYLQAETDLVNPLLHGKHPLQLQKCNSSMFNVAFDFYTVQHPGGCASAPGWARDPKDEKRIAIYEKACWITDIAVVALFVLRVLLSMYSSAFREGVQKLRGFLSELLNFRDPRKSCIERHFLFLWWIWPFWGLLGLVMYGIFFAGRSSHFVQLPDPSDFNRVLTSQGYNVSLSLCTVKDASIFPDPNFQVYVGFADSCDLVDGSVYPGNVSPGGYHGVHDTGMTLLMLAASFLAFSGWAFFGFGVLYACLFMAPGLVVKRKVHNVEMQAPAGSAV